MIPEQKNPLNTSPTMKPVRIQHPSLLVRLLLLAFSALPLIPLQSAEHRPINRTTLADAINASNANPGDDQIIFDRNIDLSSALPDINKASGTIVFHGMGHILSRSLQSGTDFRILTIRAGTVHIDSLTIRDGVAPDENGYRLGGGIYNLGTLTMSNSTVTANSATGSGGGLFSNGSAPSINNCTFSNNSSGEKGGGIFTNGTMLLSNSTITGNVSGNDGGGIRNGGNLVVSGCTISNNVSENNGGGLMNFADLQVNTSTFTGNRAVQGSGIYNEGINVTLTDSEISANSTLHYADYGGGICNELGTMTLTNCTVASNHAIAGGGISVKGGTLDITGCTITNNFAWGDGGGLWVEDKLTELNGSPYLVEGNLNVTHSTIADNSAEKGGGVYINDGTLTLLQSTISGNLAAQGRATGVASGGGLYNYEGLANLTNSTISGNTGQSGAGGIYDDNGTHLYSCTISGNQGQLVGGIYSKGQLSLQGCIVSGNTGSEAADIRVSAQTGVWLMDRYNILGCTSATTARSIVGKPVAWLDASDVLATSDGTQPTLLASILNPVLGDNGGLTLTHALVTGSPAIDLIPASENPPAIDQRGTTRPQGSLSDGGAFELVPTLSIIPVGNRSVQSGQTIQIQIDAANPSSNPLQFSATGTP